MVLLPFTPVKSHVTPGALTVILETLNELSGIEIRFVQSKSPWHCSRGGEGGGVRGQKGRDVLIAAFTQTGNGLERRTYRLGSHFRR